MKMLNHTLFNYFKNDLIGKSKVSLRLRLSLNDNWVCRSRVCRSWGWVKNETHMEKQHLLDWMKIAFQQPVDNDVEDFYFDKKTNCFFSITHLEKLLIDKNFKIQYHLSPYFSDDELKTIQKWIKNSVKKNNSIISHQKE